MPLLDLEVFRSLILHLTLSFDRFHTTDRMIYFTVVASSSGQNQQSQNITFFFPSGIKFPGRNLRREVLGVLLPINNDISCLAVEFQC